MSRPYRDIDPRLVRLHEAAKRLIDATPGAEDLTDVARLTRRDLRELFASEGITEDDIRYWVLMQDESD